MISGIFVIILMILFLGVVYWAWSDRQQATFDRMAHLPLEDDEPQFRRGDKQ
jgi:cytochrome c oxidase cbb3-type subunit 4